MKSKFVLFKPNSRMKNLEEFSDEVLSIFEEQGYVRGVYWNCYLGHVQDLYMSLALMEHSTGEYHVFDFTYESEDSPFLDLSEEPDMTFQKNIAYKMEGLDIKKYSDIDSKQLIKAFKKNFR